MKIRNITVENIKIDELFNFMEVYKKYLSENNLEDDINKLTVNSLVHFVQNIILPNIIN